MNPTQLSHIGLRLLAIYLAVQSISNIPEAYTLYRYASMMGINASMQVVNALLIVSFVTTLLVPLVLSIIIWFMTPKLSSYLVSNKNENEAISTHQFQSSALAIIGVYLLVVTIPPAVSANYRLLQVSELISQNHKSLSDVVTNAISVDLKIVFALILVFASNSIAKAISNLKSTEAN